MIIAAAKSALISFTTSSEAASFTGWSKTTACVISKVEVELISCAVDGTVEANDSLNAVE